MIPLAAGAVGPNTGAVPPATTSQAPAAGQVLVAELYLNSIAKGAFTVVAGEAGDFLVSEADLQALGVRPPYGVAVQAEGQAYQSLRALQATELRFDETRLALFVTLPAGRLPKQALSLLPGRPARVLESSDPSAFFNYRALSSGDTRGTAQGLALSTELGASARGFLLRSESSHSRGLGAGRDVRYATSLTHDDRRTLRRWILGDFTTSSGELGSTLTLGGISFSKAYQIDPYFIRRPMAGFTADIPSPAQADIYLDGVRVRSEALQPGQFELANLNYYGGQREVAVVIRDPFGREQRLVYPYYFSDVNLRQGLHEYSYNLGLQRQNLGTASNDYGTTAFSAFHRYGVSDSLTLGVRGEAEAGRFNLGPTVVLRSDRWGLLSGSLSTGRGPSGSSWAGVARYAYQARRFNSQAELRRYSPRYEAVGQLLITDRPESEMSVSASYGRPWVGNFSVDWRRLRQYSGGDRRVVSLGYSRNFMHSLNLLASVSRVAGALSSEAETNVFLALAYSPGRDITAHYFHDQRGDKSSDVLQVGNDTPVGEGFGYRFVGERNNEGFGDGFRLGTSLQYNGPHGVYTADLRSDRPPGGPAQDSYQLGIGGGIAYVGGSIAFSRPVSDSFGLVKVGELEGVRVYHSAQEIGRTDARGTVFLPNLGSYVANRVAIDDRDVPVDYTISQKELNISPSLRSGALIRFGVTRIQAITGRLTVRIKDKTQPAEYTELVLVVEGRETAFPTGRDGEIYLENLKPARYPARLALAGRTCSFELVVPSSPETLIDLGELHACQFDD